MSGGELIDGRYELHELVGSGGMSSVYRARDTLLERDVALKILHRHHLEDGDYVTRFEREARSVAQLSHPNIVTVNDRGEVDGRPFIVFEYVGGATLDKLIEREGALPVDQALEITTGAARGLAFAHRRGLIHRDVKPQNIILNGGGRPKVTDFGIARALDVHKGVTQTGTVLGTSNYIAPEQASGERVSVQSDVYSLGVVLFELLTGRTPFSGDNFVAVAMKHINEPAPSVLDLRRDVPPRVAAAVARALLKDPRERFPSMDAFAAELEACLQEVRAGSTQDPAATVVTAPVSRRPPARRPTLPRRGSPGPLIVALVALVALGVILVAALAVHGNHSGNTNTSTTGGGGGGGGGSVVKLSGTTAYDPQGDGAEDDADAPKATDGNVSTFWSTEHYTTQDFGGLKHGLGLVLNAPESIALKTLTIASDTPGFTALVRAGSSAQSAQAVSGTQTVGTKSTFDLNGPAAPVYVIWITRLAPGGVVHINEVTATR